MTIHLLINHTIFEICLRHPCSENIKFWIVFGGLVLVFFFNSVNSLVTINELLQDNTVVANIRMRHNTEICHILVLLVKMVLDLAVIS